MQALDLNSKYLKSYLTRDGLLKAIKENGIDQVQHLIIRNDSGRWMALVVGFKQEFLGNGFSMISG